MLKKCLGANCILIWCSALHHYECSGSKLDSKAKTAGLSSESQASKFKASLVFGVVGSPAIQTTITCATRTAANMLEHHAD